MSKSRRFPLRFVAFLAALGLAGGVASANRDTIGGAPQRILDEILNRSMSADVAASSNIRGRKPELATDRYVDTSWTTALKKGEYANFLEATFEGSPRLVYVFITGMSSDPPLRDKPPSKVLISVHHNGAEAGTYQNFPLVDVPSDMKRYGFYVGANDVQSVRLTVVHPTTATAKSVSIAGVQFTGR